MKFNKGDRVFHKNLELFGTFVDYAWETNAEADVDFEMEDGYIEQRHVSINQLQKCPSDEEKYMELPVRFVYTENGVEKTSVDENKRMNYIDDLNRRLLLDKSGDGRQRITNIDDYRSGKIPL